MTDAPYDLLGPSEKLVAKQLRESIEGSIAGASKLVEVLGEIDLDALDAVMLDSGKAAVTIAGPLAQLANNLSQAHLTAMLAAIFLQPGGPKDEA